MIDNEKGVNCYEYLKNRSPIFLAAFNAEFPLFPQEHVNKHPPKYLILGENPGLYFLIFSPH